MPRIVILATFFLLGAANGEVSFRLQERCGPGLRRRNGVSNEGISAYIVLTASYTFIRPEDGATVSGPDRIKTFPTGAVKGDRAKGFVVRMDLHGTLPCPKMGQESRISI